MDVIGGQSVLKLSCKLAYFIIEPPALRASKPSDLTVFHIILPQQIAVH